MAVLCFKHWASNSQGRNNKSSAVLEPEALLCGGHYLSEVLVDKIITN